MYIELIEMTDKINHDLFELVPEVLEQDGSCACKKTDEDRQKVFGLVRNMPIDEGEKVSEGQIALTNAAEVNNVGSYVEKWLELNNLRR